MPEPRQPIRADDAELLGLAAVGYSAFGGDETVALSVARQLGESLRRLAESQMRLFRSRIEEPLIASDIGQPPSNSDAISAIAMPC
jgi:predicted lipid-binding transport protein (Tim44 family)